MFLSLEHDVITPMRGGGRRDELGGCVDPYVHCLVLGVQRIAVATWPITRNQWRAVWLV